MLPFERAFWPFWPRPAVLPSPDPTPRPTRSRSVFAPSGAWSLERMSMGLSLVDRRRLLAGLDLLDLEEVHHLLDHPPEPGRVGHEHLGAGAPQAEALDDEALAVVPADGARLLADLEERLHWAPPSPLAGAAGAPGAMLVRLRALVMAAPRRW